MRPNAVPTASRFRAAPSRPVRQPSASLVLHDRRRLSDGIVTGVEAQIRWPGMRAGALPGSALDETPLAVDAVASFLASAFHQARLTGHLLLSVAVPGWFLQSDTLLQAASETLADTGVEAEQLEFAIPEAGLDGHCTDTLLALSALRDLGVGLAMDGFGRRDASLLTLKRLPLTALKLDGALVADAAYDEGAAALIGAAADFAHRLDMIVVAAMPQDHGALAILRRASCDEVVERGPAWPAPEFAAPGLPDRAPAPVRQHAGAWA